MRMHITCPYVLEVRVDAVCSRHCMRKASSVQTLTSFFHTCRRARAMAALLGREGSASRCRRRRMCGPPSIEPEPIAGRLALPRSVCGSSADASARAVDAA